MMPYITRIFGIPFDKVQIAHAMIGIQKLSIFAVFSGK